MTITAIARNFDGTPNIVTMVTTSTLAEITTAGFLTLPATLADIEQLQNGEFQWTDTDVILIDYDGGAGWFKQDTTTNTFTLSVQSAGNAVLPTIADRIAVFTDTAGTIGLGGATIVHNGDIATINGGDFRTDSGGLFVAVGGGFISQPPSPGTGALSLFAADAGGFNLFINNEVMTQNTALVIPSIDNSAGRFVIAENATPFVAGHFVIADGSNSNGTVKDSGAALISGTTAAWGGGGTTNNFVIAGMTAAYQGAIQIRSQTNAASIVLATPGAGFVTVQFSADPGAATTLSYIYSSAALA